MKDLITRPLNRRQYYLYLLFSVIGIVVASLINAEVGYQLNEAVISSVLRLKLIWLPIEVIMCVLMFRRLSDIGNREIEVKNTLMLSIVLSAIFTFSPFTRPKYLLIILLIVGIFPKRKKNSEESL